MQGDLVRSIEALILAMEGENRGFQVCKLGPQNSDRAPKHNLE